MKTLLSKPLSSLCIVAMIGMPLAAAAKNGPPPGPPIGEMAAQLGVKEAALKTCMPRPAQGARPERPDPAAIADCLDLDEKTVAKVLEANAPAMPPRSN